MPFSEGNPCLGRVPGGMEVRSVGRGREKLSFHCVGSDAIGRGAIPVEGESAMGDGRPDSLAFWGLLFGFLPPFYSYAALYSTVLASFFAPYISRTGNKQFPSVQWLSLYAMVGGHQSTRCLATYALRVFCYPVACPSLPVDMCRHGMRTPPLP